MPAERLQKIMAAAGVGSRRTCEELIAAGRVEVNGKTVTELGVKADARRDRIVVDGKRLEFKHDHLYFKVHKPRGVLSDTEDGEGERRTVLDLLPPDTGRVFPVGRLDLHSEGLVLLTDDGELANRLTHPRFQHPKTYFVLVEMLPTQEALAQLRAGIDLPEGRTAPALVEVAEQLPAELQLSKGPTEGVWLRIVLREGKKRQIRHMTAAVGYPALRLVRWSIGSLTLGRLWLGQCAALTPGEVGALRRMVGLPTADLPAAKPTSKPPQEARRTPERAAGKAAQRKPGAGAPYEAQPTGARPGYKGKLTGARPGYKPKPSGAGAADEAQSTGARPGYKGKPTGARPGYKPKPSGAGAADEAQSTGARPGYKGKPTGARPGYKPKPSGAADEAQSTGARPGYKGKPYGARPGYKPKPVGAADEAQTTGARPGYKGKPTGARPGYKPKAAGARYASANPVRAGARRTPRKPAAPGKRGGESHG